MEKNEVLDFLINNPDILLEIVGEILNQYHSNIDHIGIAESKMQLVEISKTIDRLECTGIPVPDELRNLKSSLLAASNNSKQAQTRYEMIIRGLNDLCSKYKINGHTKPRVRRRSRDDGSPVRKGRLTPRKTLIRAIVQVMEQMGNSGHKREIHNRLENVLADVLNPEDYELDSSGLVTWHHQVDWARMYMVQIGMMRNDSPRGVWELTENYKELLDGLK
jgi:hypothetical protein